MSKHGMTRTGRIAGALATIVFLSGAWGSGTASAQETDERWLAWLGCWQPVAETATSTAPSTAIDELVCFRRLSGDVGVELVSADNGQISTRHSVRADGEQHESSSDGCTGWDRSHFASRATRVFLHSEHICENGEIQTSTGLLAMVSSSEWVQVNVVAGGGTRTAWVTRYRLAPRSVVEEAGLSDIAADHGMEGRSARVAAAARPSVEDVIEASQYVEEEGVSAWIAELGLRFELDADRLIQMADAGVSEDVIDMVVAVSYPSHFAVDRERYSPDYGPTYSSFGGWGFSQPLYSSRFFSPYGYCSPYRYGFGYGGCGYRGYGFGGYGYGGYRSPVIIVIDRSGSGGRVVNGQGYRRGESSGATGSRGASPRGYVGGSSGSSAGSRSSTEPSRGTSTGRKAKRKDGGG